MLGYIQIVTLDFFEFYILYQGKERCANTKLMLAKLCAVLATFGYLECHLLTPSCVSLREV